MNDKRATEPLRYELTTTLSISGLATEAFDEWVAKFDAAVYDETGMYPAVTEYFVTGAATTMEVEVGLAFEGADPTKIQVIAAEIVEEALESVERGDPTPRAVREESMLVPA